MADLNMDKYDFINYLYHNIVIHFTTLHIWFLLGTLFVLHNVINFNKKITNYFLIHFIFNMYVSFNTFENTIEILYNPYAVFTTNNYVSFAVVLFHIYHIIYYYNDIKIDEMIHHIWIVFIILPITWLNYCNIADSSLFFMTGLPGGITYLLLVLKETKYISSMTEKYISKHLNMWIRIPGSIIVGYIIFVNAMIATTMFATISLVFCSLGCLWNGVYFGSTIISSHALLEEKNKKKVIANID
jgi:hypothetical protein